jgi:plasmid stabilization system protein ParE
MRRYAILLSQRASREIDAARAWWIEHRDPTAGVFDDAIATALGRLEAFPEMGPRVRIRARWSATVRRVQLDPIGYHLYYRVDGPEERIVVICFWHERRRSPRL